MNVIVDEVYLGHTIASNEIVKSPTTRPYDGLVVLAPNGMCLTHGLHSIEDAKLYIDKDIEANNAIANG